MRNLFVAVTCITLISFLMGCQTGRTATIFGFSRSVPDTTTDPEQLSRELEATFDLGGHRHHSDPKQSDKELEDTLRESERNRLEKLQAAPKSESKEKSSE